MDKTEVVKKVHALMNDKNNYTARLQAEEVVEKYVEQRLETASAVDTIVSVPDDVKGFIRKVTLDLQQHRSKSEKDLDNIFQDCYKMYVKYKVDKAH